LIRNFLVFEHVPFDANNLPDIRLTERKLRESAEEIAAELVGTASGLS
jgi:hypothetical protein